MNTDLSILCRINGNDEIIFFDERWLRFAVLNYDCNFVEDKILRHSLWDFFHDITSEHLYRRMLNRVRNGYDVQFDFRWDSADHIRVFEMKISLQKMNEILFEVRILKEKPRLQQSSFDNELKQTDKMLIICSWCDRINIEADNWQEVEKAVKTLKLFEFHNLPQLSHGMCNDCYKKVSKQFSINK